MKGEIFCKLTALGVDFSLLFLITRSKQLCFSLDSFYQFFISGLFGIVTISVAEDYSKKDWPFPDFQLPLYLLTHDVSTIEPPQEWLRSVLRCSHHRGSSILLPLCYALKVSLYFKFKVLILYLMTLLCSFHNTTPSMSNEVWPTVWCTVHHSFLVFISLRITWTDLIMF